MIHNKYSLFIFCLLVNISLFAPPLQAVDAKEDFYFDVIVFKGDKQDSARADIFAIIPNEKLNFVKLNETQTNEVFSASYELVVSITSTANNKIIATRKFSNVIYANSLLEAQGSKAEFSQIIDQIYLPEDNYKIRAVLTDKIAKREFEKNRAITVVNFSKYPFGCSSIMLVSSIEENNGKYLITPHISDNIGNLQEGYFAFFEFYNNSENEKKIDILTEIYDNETKKVIFSDQNPRNIHSGTNQIYARIPNGINYGMKLFALRIYCIDADNVGTANEKNETQILAAAQRSIKSISFLSNRIIANLDNAIRQMRYAANSKEMDYIKEAPDETEKLKRFEKFWKELDPTPNTERNEAMEEYYNRIDYANTSFKAYSEGWMTDKGQVFVTYGMPLNVERTNRSYADSRTLEKWTYANNRVFIFIDTTGFGDFRLYSPTLISDKYEYDND